MENNSKKILIFSTAYYPYVGGAEVAIKEITDRIQDAEFTLITARMSKKIPFREKVGNVTVYRLGIGVPFVDKLILPIEGALFARHLLKKKKYDAFWGMMVTFGSLGAYIYNLFSNNKIPVTLTLQEGDSEEHFKKKWFGLINLSWKLALKRTDRLTVISTYLGERARTFGYKGKMRLVQNGVNIKSFTLPIGEDERASLREELGFKDGDIGLITTSRLVLKNGIGDVIKALPYLEKNIKFAVFGSGVLENELKKLAKSIGVEDRVIFKGFVDQSLIPKYLKASDIFIRPSISEGMGNSFIESFAARVRVVATRVGGIADFLEDGKTGYVCESENPKSVAGAITKAITDPDKDKVIENAYKLAVEKYDWKNIAMRMKEDFDLKIKVAVVGGGIFGGTSAVKLANSGMEVDLFEKEKDLLQSASGINQYRLHRGYHYPRSISTALSSKSSEESFLGEYGEAVYRNIEHYYCIAKDGSKIDRNHFLEFCDKCGLEYEEVSLGCINKDSVQLTIKGKESLIDPLKLKEILNNKINTSKVKLFLGTVFNTDMIERYDYVINATYANLNHILNDNNQKRTYQFEVCEKPLLKLPPMFKGKSIVILDGAFMCIDPYANTDMHVMGNVVHAIHATNTGEFPIIPEKLKPLLNKGIIKNPPITNINKFIESAIYFMPEIKGAEHVGSMYTVRTVLPNVDATDERPTIVSRLGESVINVFSGKLGNCVESAEQVLNIIENR